VSKEETKSCIACAEDIKSAAMLCKHCNTRQDEASFRGKETSSQSKEPSSPNQTREFLLSKVLKKTKPEFVAILGIVVVVGLVVFVPMFSETPQDTKAMITPKPQITFPEQLPSASPSTTSSSSTTTSNSKASQASTVVTPPSGQVSSQTTPPAITVPLGSAITTPNFALTINSVEILDQIGTVNGGALVAPAGTKLVLLRTTISVYGDAIDLSCASGMAMFTTGFDSNGSEMAHVWETHLIPGNPRCNIKTTAGETVAWNFAFKMSADRTPSHMSLWEDYNGPSPQEFRALLR